MNKSRYFFALFFLISLSYNNALPMQWVAEKFTGMFSGIFGGPATQAPEESPITNVISNLNATENSVLQELTKLVIKKNTLEKEITLIKTAGNIQKNSTLSSKQQQLKVVKQRMQQLSKMQGNLTQMQSSIQAAKTRREAQASSVTLVLPVNLSEQAELESDPALSNETQEDQPGQQQEVKEEKISTKEFLDK